MKKSKIITGLSAGFIAAIALSSCSLIKSNGDIVLTIGGEKYTANDLFKDQKSAAAGEAKFNAVYRVAVRQYFTKDKPGYAKMDQIKKDTQNKISGQKDTAQSNANKNGTSYDTEWNKILTSNGVEDEQGLYDKFEYELQKSEFDDQFYEQNLDVLKNGGNLKQKEVESKISVPGYLKKKQPYHVRHILVKVTAAANDPTRGEITENEAKKLHDVIVSLANGNNFGDVAKWYSEDTGSKDNFGDLGIMDRDTSFVNEFKLGTYVYESYFGKSTQKHDGTTEYDKYNTSVAKNEIFGLDDKKTSTPASEFADKISQIVDPSGLNGEKGSLNGLGQIPYEAALALGNENYVYNVNGQGTKQYRKGLGNVQFSNTLSGILPASDDKATYYPRNVIFNKFFNKNNIMVITPRGLSLADGINGIDKQEEAAKTNVKKIVQMDTGVEGKPQFKFINHNDKEAGETPTNTYKGTKSNYFENEDNFPGFKGDTKAKNSDKLNVTLSDSEDNKILRDENGRTIFVFRSGTTGDSSYQGIHFVCIERSPFIGNEYSDSDEAHKDEAVTKSDYYTYYYPKQDGGHYPTYSDGKTLKPTYVNAINSPEISDLKTRADAVKTKIKGYDSNLNTYVYEYLLSVGQIQFAKTEEAEKLNTTISNWITLKREDSEYTANNTWNDTWETYYNKINESTKAREQMIVDGKCRSGIISEACAIAYAYIKDTSILSGLFGTGGAFHAE